ncbi:uncharacterized protein BcabD6B2_56390 [Babesia caballi]|uniref:Uncharacterized protein n=1 Tax=Babesia caballi TaxID=5871 RepID=A0AAV4M1Y4_BABCB|nr:hypothetical protein BcabD6B2_56390 [Babesia caballi]
MLSLLTVGGTNGGIVQVNLSATHEPPAAGPTVQLRGGAGDVGARTADGRVGGEDQVHALVHPEVPPRLLQEAKVEVALEARRLEHSVAEGRQAVDAQRDEVHGDRLVGLRPVGLWRVGCDGRHPHEAAEGAAAHVVAVGDGHLDFDPAIGGAGASGFHWNARLAGFGASARRRGERRAMCKVAPRRW